MKDGSVSMNFVNCNLCNNNDTELVYRINEISIVRCRKCGLIYQNPRYEQAKDLYSEEFYEQFYGNKERLLSSAQVLIEKIAKYVPTKVRILEVGAGLGYTLKIAKDKGWEAFGTEISPFAVRYAQEEFGLKIFKGSLKEAKFPENFFDLVIMIHVLEHLSDPAKSLERVFHILKKSGVLYIVVPNISSFKAWIKKEKWRCLVPKYHFYHFCPRTLKKIVLKAGFKGIHIETAQKIITAEDLSKTRIASLSFVGEKLKNIKRHFPFILDGVRDFIGKFIPGEGITLVAKK